MAVWVFAALLWLVLATEARADDATVSSDGAAATADDPQLGGMPPVGDTAETPAEEPAGDPALPVESPAPETPAPAPEPPPPPAPDPVGQPPAAPSPPAPPSPAPESPVVTPPVATPPPEVPTAEPTLPAAGPIPVEPSPATGSSGESIFTIPNGSSPPPPLELPYLSDAGGALAAVTWAGDRLDRQSGSRSETRHEGPRAAGSAGTAPLPPPPPFKDQAPSRLFVSTGGLSGGSSGGFSVGMLAALIALLAVAVQLLCSLVSLRLAPPRGNAFALRLIRPG